MCLYVKGGGGGAWLGSRALKNTGLITLFWGNLSVDMEIGLQGSG